jgi:heme oxygenase
VHAALERAIARCTHGLPRAPGYALLAAFHRPELHRASAIEDDLASIGVQLLPPRHAPAALAYAARILRVERESPIVLVAHAYLRFGSDLANSHIAGCVARRALSLPDHATLHYFAHPAIADRPAYLAELTAYVDAIPRAYHDPIAGEARAAALLHRAMLDELFAHLHRTRPLTPIAAARLGAPSLH